MFPEPSSQGPDYIMCLIERRCWSNKVIDKSLFLKAKSDLPGYFQAIILMTFCLVIFQVFAQAQITYWT